MRRDRVGTTGTMQMRLQGSRPATRDRSRWSGHAAVAVVVAGVALSACSLHVSRHGISGNILGHSFSGAEGVLPAGFPNNVPVPDHSRVLAGGGTNNAWDVAFAVTGPVTPGTSGYESKLGAAGYTITNIRSGSTPVTAVTYAGSGSTSTTITVAGTEFTAADSSWTIQVASGTTTSPTGGGLKAGEFAINITVISHPSGTTPSTFGLRAGVQQEPGVAPTIRRWTPSPRLEQADDLSFDEAAFGRDHGRRAGSVTVACRTQTGDRASERDDRRRGGGSIGSQRARGHD